MAPTFSIHYDNRGRLGETVDFNPDNDNNGLWVEGSDAAGGESAGIFMNGNTLVVWSPGDNDLVKVFDEDGLATGAPVLRIDGGGAIIHRTTQIHADHVFEPEFPLESIEQHASAMMSEQHLAAVPPAETDSEGNMVVNYAALLRGLLEELEKAHIYIARINDVVKTQQGLLSTLTARVEAVPAT
jgi:hypothetical protein